MKGFNGEGFSTFAIEAFFPNPRISINTMDLIIIGAGPGGYPTAIAAAQAGLQVALIERQHLGGTCLGEGCIPTKTLCRSAEVMDTIRESATFGIALPEGAAPQVDLPAVIQRKEQVIATLRQGILGLMRTPGITLMEGTARFLDAHTLCVQTAEGEQTLTAPHIIIATGSESRSLPIPGADLPQVMDSTALLACTEMPRHLCVIGGGVIGLEFASIFRSFGAEVTVVEYAPEVLPRFDKDMAKRLRTSLKRRGITFHVGAAVTAIEATADGQAQVKFTRKGKEEAIVADRVLMAVGRGPRLEGLDLSAAGIAHTPRGIEVDEWMQTSVLGVYAIGDCNGRCQLAHAATYQGKQALRHLLGQTERPIRLDIVPSAVFTVPELATVGLTEEECQAQGIAYTVRKANYLSNGKAQSAATTEGLVKQLYDSTTGQLLGAHILGAHAADLIHECTLQLTTQTSATALADMIHAHPTLSELLV